MIQTNLFDSSQTSTGLDPTKTLRQEEIIDKWQDNNGKGTIVAVTGFGKTRALLEGAKRLCNSPNAQSQRDVTVIVPLIHLKDEWEELLKYYDFPSKVFVVNSFVNEYTHRNPRRTSLLILDEFHRYHSEVFGTIFDRIQYNFIFGATATIDDEDPKFVRMKKLAPVIDEVTLEEARANNWVSSFRIYNLGIEMSNLEQNTYDNLGRKFNKYFKTFDFDFDLAMKCLTDDVVRRNRARQMNWDEQALMVHAVQFSRTVQERKKFLYELPSKIKTAKDIIHRFSDHIFITFSESTDFADQLADELPEIAVPYHSSLRTLITVKGNRNKVIAIAEETENGKRYRDLETSILYTWKGIKSAHPDKHLVRRGKKTRRKDSLNLFKDDQSNYRVISTAKALDEGFNVPKINASIVTSGTSKTRQSIQRLGRMIRQKEGKTAFQVEIYIKNTQDEVWLRKRQEESINIEWIDSINEIKIT